MEWPISPPRRLASLLGKRIYAEPPPLCTQRVRGGHFQNLSCQGWGGGGSPRTLPYKRGITSAFSLPLPTVQVPGGSLPAFN